MVGSNEVLFDSSKKFLQHNQANSAKDKNESYPGQNHVRLLTDIHSGGSKAALQDIKAIYTNLEPPTSVLQWGAIVYSSVWHIFDQLLN